MKKVRIFPAPHMEIKLHISDEMIKGIKNAGRCSMKLGMVQIAMYVAGRMSKLET